MLCNFAESAIKQRQVDRILEYYRFESTFLVLCPVTHVPRAHSCRQCLILTKISNPQNRLKIKFDGTQNVYRIQIYICILSLMVLKMCTDIYLYIYFFESRVFSHA